MPHIRACWPVTPPSSILDLANGAIGGLSSPVTSIIRDTRHYGHIPRPQSPPITRSQARHRLIQQNTPPTPAPSSPSACSGSLHFPCCFLTPPQLKRRGIARPSPENAGFELVIDEFSNSAYKSRCSGPRCLVINSLGRLTVPSRSFVTRGSGEGPLLRSPSEWVRAPNRRSFGPIQHPRWCPQSFELTGFVEDAKEQEFDGAPTPNPNNSGTAVLTEVPHCMAPHMSLLHRLPLLFAPESGGGRRV